jgi:cytochrome c oxidase subunit 1
MNEEERKILSLRFVVVALVFLGLAGIEGLLMRLRIMNLLVDVFDEKHFYSMMTAHPFVGVYGWAYMAVMGAFYFLVPYVLNKDIYSKRAAYASFWLMILGIATIWTTTFLTHYAPLYTLYWPIPVAADLAGWSPVAIVSFGAGVSLILAGVLIFFFNMFATIFLPPRVSSEIIKKRSAGYVAKELILTAFNIDKLIARFRKIPQYTSRAFEYPVFVVAVFRGCIDTTLNAFVIGSIGIILMSVGAYYLLPGAVQNLSLIDPLIYKNVFWWGLDLIADGNVLIFTAGDVVSHRSADVE